MTGDREEREGMDDGTVRVRHRKSREADKTLVFATLVMFHLSPTHLTLTLPLTRSIHSVSPLSLLHPSSPVPFSRPPIVSSLRT